VTWITFVQAGMAWHAVAPRGTARQIGVWVVRCHGRQLGVCLTIGVLSIERTAFSPRHLRDIDCHRARRTGGRRPRAAAGTTRSPRRLYARA